jgi:NADPH:quinone reductase-like Zn-dependent oxidoreductase
MPADQKPRGKSPAIKYPVAMSPGSKAVKPGKLQSATMNEQTFVPVSMRALYYHVAPVSTSPEGDLTGEIFPDDASGAGSRSSIISPKANTSEIESIPILTLDTEFPTPCPTPYQYLLKIQTAAFCQDELRLANDLNPRTTTPKVPLHSICGTVISTPTADYDKADGPRFKIGDKVFGLLSYTRDGGAADYSIATENELALKPSNISAGEAATIALPALTAWQALFRYGGLDPDASHNGLRNNHSNGNSITHQYSPESWNAHEAAMGMAAASGSTAGNSNSTNNGRNGNTFRSSIASVNEHLNKRGFSHSSGSSGPHRLRDSISQLQERFSGNRTGKGGTSITDGLGEQRKGSLHSIEGGSSRSRSSSIFSFRKAGPVRVLVTNARDSEVGRLTVQMLRAEKLFPSMRPWICVTCSPAEERIVRGEWDVDGVIVIPHLPTESEAAIGSEFRRRKWSPADLVLDCTGGEVFRQAHGAVRDHGVVLTAVDPWLAWELENGDEQDVLGRRKRGLRTRFVPVNPDSEGLERIVDLVEENMLRGREEQIVDLVNAAKLLEAGAAGLAGSRRGGMVVVRVNP